eukprot:Pgem_evm1s18304
MKFSTAIAFFAVASTATASPVETTLNLPVGATFSHLQGFMNWVQEHSKSYQTDAEQMEKFAVWFNNFLMIEEHNADSKNTYTLRMNEFGDATNEEFVKYRNNYRSNQKIKATGVHKASATANPASVNWVTEGAVTPIKDQGQCGSCWTFSTTGGLEGQWFLKKNKLISLSEQQILDCSTNNGNDGCNGGLMDGANTYIQNEGGLTLESDYKYTAKQGTCRDSSVTKYATNSGHHDITQGSESDLTDAVATIGPISVAIDASSNSFQFYHSGIYNPSGCSTTRLDHAVLVVGYGSDSDGDYYLVKNSWGTTWGDEGYIKMARNANNECGIASEASYPIVTAETTVTN